VTERRNKGETFSEKRGKASLLAVEGRPGYLVGGEGHLLARRG